ncbi:hypothetical protein GWI33_013945 [Rhynchophorus ferrugineus]|uniref:Uncharacterized protein n=1 Tax=Rhynchophorus ferrugineus TaxID=354439 RepID=A0A834M7C3_RHYFE|nr:hypothetical protein GWI33_013945 [Rhynchophorus ferrugineus]
MFSQQFVSQKRTDYSKKLIISLRSVNPSQMETPTTGINPTKSDYKIYLSKLDVKPRKFHHELQLSPRLYPGDREPNRFVINSMVSGVLRTATALGSAWTGQKEEIDAVVGRGGTPGP